MYYMVKCFYLLLSAYQIRCGYPTRISGYFLCKGYNYVNMFLFKGFMAVPFLFELRTVMDWMWTDTSMAIFDWIKMEDIFAHIFQIKASLSRRLTKLCFYSTRIPVHPSRGGRVSATARRTQVANEQVRDGQRRPGVAHRNHLVPASVLFAGERGGQGESAVRSYRRAAHRPLPADL